jgi:hypothetical protein
MSKIKFEGNASGTGTLTVTSPNTNSDTTIALPETTGGEFIVSDSNGKVGIGTSSPISKFDVNGGDLTVQDTTPNIYLRSEGNVNNIQINANINDSVQGGVGIYENGTPLISSRINLTQFYTAGTERMRITGSGYLLFNGSNNFPGVGNTDTGFSLEPAADGVSTFVSREATAALNLNRNSDNQIANFRRSGSVVGNISVTSSSTSYNTSSDYRLKTDVQPMTGATERLKALKPVNFEWISSGERVDGFLAHEAAEVVPEAVTGTKDGMTTQEYEVTPAVLDDDGNVIEQAVMGEREVPDYQGIDQSKLVPLLVATIQELEARIAALESN